MTDPVEALAAALPDVMDQAMTDELYGPGTSWLDAPDEWFLSPREFATDMLAALRASGFDVVPTGDAHPDDGHAHSWGCRRCGVDPVTLGEATEKPTGEPAGSADAATYLDDVSYQSGYEDGRAVGRAESTGTPPEGTRLILASDNLLDLIGTRAEDGGRLTYEWGDPDEHGWYSPTITKHEPEPTGTLDVERLHIALAEAFAGNIISLTMAENLAAEYARLSSSDTGERR